MADRSKGRGHRPRNEMHANEDRGGMYERIEQDGDGRVGPAKCIYYFYSFLFNN